MGKRAAILQFIKAFAGRFARFERTAWIVLLGVFVLSSGLRLAATKWDEVGVWAEQSQFLSATYFDLLGWVQAGALTFVVAIPLLLALLSRNPAQALTQAAQPQKQPELFRDLEALFKHQQLRFVASALRPVEDEKDVVVISDLNAICFANSAHYAGDFDEKLARNQSIFKAYKGAFALIHDTNHALMGFSMVIPLNEDATELYKAGRLSDLDVRGIHLPKKGAPAGCFLLFAIGLVPALEAARGGERNPNYVRQIVRYHALHAVNVTHDFPTDDALFVVQAEKRSIVKMLQGLGFALSALRGADGDPLLFAPMSKLVDQLKDVAA